MKTIRHQIEEIDEKIKQLEREADDLEGIACQTCDGSGSRVYYTKDSYIIDTCGECRGSGMQGD